MQAIKLVQVSNNDPTMHAMGAQVLAAAGSSQTDAAQVTAAPWSLVHATGADATKGIILPAGVKGYWYLVKNSDAANAILKVYPATGGQINALGSNNPISMAAKTACMFACIDGTNWFTLPLLPS